MTTIRIITLCLLMLAGTTLTFGQTDLADNGGKSRTHPVTTVTVSVSAKGVRFTAPGFLGQMRLEVFGAGGDSLYNSDFRPGAVRDWAPQDKQGQALPDGRYLCVVTLRDLSGRLSVKQGTVVLEGNQAALQLDASEQVGVVKPEQALDKAPGAAALTVHDGAEGQVVSTRGALTFRLGDFFGGTDRERMRITPEGRVGISTDKPEAALDVNGTVRARAGFEFADGSRLAVGEGGTLVRTTAGGEPLPGLTSAAAATAGRIAKFTDGAGTLTDSSVFETGGFVGIGTTAPEGTFHIESPSTTVFKVVTSGSAATGRAVFQMYRGTANDSNGWDFGYNTDLATEGFIVRELTNAAPTTRFSIQKGTGNVGIGTASPQAKLEVAGSLKLTGAGAGITFADGSVQTTASTGGPGGLSGAGTASFLPLWTAPSALGDSVITQAAGNVGINTISPQAKLHVGGDLKVTGSAVVDGNIAAKYQDVAEWVPARQQLAAGTVVVLDTTFNNTVAASHRAYDTHVAGVVSAQPGVILGEGGADKVLVATTGRVKVRVDATRRPIRIGDLLVTSGKSGVAMRSRPVKAGAVLLHRPGTIIGKALEPLAKGEGEILVLLSLQ